MQTDDQLKAETQLIERWLHGTTEPFDDWEWDGRELTLFLHNQPIEKYARKTLVEAIPGFPANQRSDVVDP